VRRHLIEILTLRVCFARDDPSVLIKGDRALVFEFEAGPHALRDDGTRKPVHSECKIVDAAKVSVRRYLSLFHGPK